MNEKELRELVIQDRNIIRVLQRSIESLTMQMKGITQVTFERDAYKNGMEVQKEILFDVIEERDRLRKRIKELEKYETN